jgi:hypothetical protein
MMPQPVAARNRQPAGDEHSVARLDVHRVEIIRQIIFSTLRGMLSRVLRMEPYCTKLSFGGNSRCLMCPQLGDVMGRNYPFPCRGAEPTRTWDERWASTCSIRRQARQYYKLSVMQNE